MNRFRSLFAGPRRYSIPAFLLLLTVLLSGFIQQMVLSSRAENPAALLKERREEMASDASRNFAARQQQLLDFSKQFSAVIDKAGKENVLESVRELPVPSGCAYLLTRGDSVIAWQGDLALTPADADNLSFLPGETFFYAAPLKTCLLSVIPQAGRTANSYFICGIVFEDKASGPVSGGEGFAAKLENELGTEVRVEYHPYSAPSKDGRYGSVEMRNNAGKKIGLITIKNPSPRSEAQKLTAAFSGVQGALIVLIYLLLGLAVSRDFSAIRRSWLKPLLFLLYLSGLRWLMLKLEIPAAFLPGDLTDPVKFSSKFGAGLVKSPAEFLVTVSFFFAWALYLLVFLGRHTVEISAKIRDSYFFRAASLLTYVALILLGIRGFAAVIKSVIYDSTMRYFAAPIIIPAEAQLMMIVGTLIFGTASVLMFVVLFNLHLAVHPRLSLIPRPRLLLAETVLLGIAAVFFLLVQADPLLSYPLFALMLAMIHFMFSLRLTGRFAFFNFIVVAGIFASFITIVLMNHFNSELERDSLQTIASEINRPQNEFLLYLTNELLNKAAESGELKSAFSRDNVNLNAAAFALWRESSLRFEPVQSAVRILDKGKKEAGSFQAGEDIDSKNIPRLLLASGEGLQLRVIPDTARFHTAGIIPVTENGILLGYVFCEIVFEPGFLISDGVPAFLRESPLLVNNMIRPEDLNFFILGADAPLNVYGDFMPRTEQLREIAALREKKDNDAWHRFSFNNEHYVAYAQKLSDAKDTRILVVALKEKELEWSFFNFFKVFIIHSMMIFLTVLGHGIFSFVRRRAIPLTFRAQLLIAFLTISILPVVALALYNRYSTNEKTRATVQSTLANNLSTVERQMGKSAASPAELRSAAETIFRNSGLLFTVYDKGRLLVSSAPYLYTTTLLPERLGNDVVYNMEQGGLKQYFTSHRFGGKEYYALYEKLKLGGDTYIIEANSLLNFIPGMYSPFDVDVFLFGIYSFAIMMIIAMSSILANRIALPIRRLTQATQSVAHGDLNIKLDGQVHGELKELFDGFNTMTEELHRNQSELASLEREVAWKEFAKQVAHEIKNPLTPMKLTMQQLMAAYRDKSPHFDTIFTKVSGTILNQIETLNAIASEFSHFARMPALKVERLDMLPLLHECIGLFQNENILMSVKTDGMQTIMVDGDGSQFRRMFVNFIRNAVQAQATELEFAVAESGNAFVLSITDNGTGIPLGLEEKIFESNFTTKSSGMGLGLKLAKRYLESIGGSIALDRTRHIGVRFLLTLKKP